MHASDHPASSPVLELIAEFEAPLPPTDRFTDRSAGALARGIFDDYVQALEGLAADARVWLPCMGVTFFYFCRWANAKAGTVTRSGGTNRSGVEEIGSIGERRAYCIYRGRRQRARLRYDRLRCKRLRGQAENGERCPREERASQSSTHCLLPVSDA